MKSIYLDYAAASPVDERVFAAMQPYFTEQFYNPSSAYLAAKAVHRSLEDARARVAYWLGAKLAEVIFTAGATESINMAINGVMRQHEGAEVLALAIEHDAVLSAARQYNFTPIPVHADGMANIEALKKLITDKTVLISVGYANNEIGTIQTLKDIALIIAEVRRLRQLKNNKLPLYLHSDASQVACFLDIHVSRLGVDLFTLNGAKMYGPKQSGVLFVKAGVALHPFIVGGGQEQGLRSGTENMANIIGLATALDIAQTERHEAIAKIGTLRDELQRLLVAGLPNIVVNGSLKKRLPNNLHISLPGVDGERLLMELDERGIMASTGAACAANKHTKSQVLEAVGCDETTAQGSLRLTLGRHTTQKEITTAARIIIEAVKK